MKLSKSQKLTKKLQNHLKKLKSLIEKTGKSFFNSLDLQSVQSGIADKVLDEYRQMLLNIYHCWTIETIKNEYLFERATCFHFKVLDELHTEYINLSTQYQHKAVLALQSTPESDQKKKFIKAWNNEYQLIPKELNKHKLSAKITEQMKIYWKITD